MNKLKTYWAKFKWYLLALLVASAFVLYLFRGKRSGVPKIILEEALKGQRSVIRKELDRKAKNEELLEEELFDIEAQISAAEGRAGSGMVDEMDLKELANAWKKLNM